MERVKREPASGERLREELRELGYLENPLARFFAGAIAGKRPRFWTHVRIGIGVGVVLGGVVAVLGALVAAAAGRSAAPLALAVFAGAGFASAALFGLLASGVLFLVFRWTRGLVDKAELAARSAGLCVFLLAFAYLLVFWRTYGPGIAARSGLPSVLVHALAALAIAAASALAGLVLRQAAFAVVALIPGYAVAPRRGARGALIAGALGLLLAAAGAVVALGARPASEFAEHGDAIARGEARARRIALVALDGLSFDNAVAALASGWMPELAAIAEAGFLRPLAPGTSAVPPAFWTTVATGLAADRHGIEAYWQDRVAGLSQVLAGAEGTAPLDALAFLIRALGLGEDVAFSGSTLRVMRIADVAAAGGLAVASVNYWATYPAESSPGITVSERAYLDLRAARQASRAGAEVAGDPRVVAPASLAPRLLVGLEEADAVARAVPAVAAAGRLGHNKTVRPILYDLFVQRAALEIARGERPDYLQVGLTGLDILRHALRSEAARETDVWLAADGAILADHHRFVDRFLGALRAAVGPDGMIVVATFPGISAQDPAALGLVAVAGGGAGKGEDGRPMAAAALAPTLLHALGLPASREQDGRVDLGWFRDQGLASGAAEPRMVAAFGLKPLRPTADPSSAEFLDWLSQLGYF